MIQDLSSQPGVAKDFEQKYLDYIKFKCLIMSERYIRGHFAEIMKYANVIEKCLDDSYCTLESVLLDNATMLELARDHGTDYLLIDDMYDVRLDI